MTRAYILTSDLLGKKQQEEDEKKQRADEIFAELEARNQGREYIARSNSDSVDNNNKGNGDKHDGEQSTK
jgi:hypothetical protein